MSGVKKRTMYRDPATGWLMLLSKRALCDVVIDLLRGASESCDEPVTVETARERVAPVLAMRGDRIPPPDASY